MNAGGSGIPQFQAHATLTPALLQMPADGRDSVLQVQDAVRTSGKAPPPARASALPSVLLAAGGPVWAAASGRPSSLAPKGHRGSGNRVGPSRESEQLRAARPLPAPGGRVSSLSPLAQRPEDAGPVQIRAWLPGRA